jgi:hypothetical protein
MESEGILPAGGWDKVDRICFAKEEEDEGRLKAR